MARHGRDERDRTDLQEIQTAGRRVAMLAQQLRAFTCDGLVRVAEVDLNLVLAAVERRLGGFFQDGISSKPGSGTMRMLTAIADASPSQRILAEVVERLKEACRARPRLGLTAADASALLDLDIRVCEGLLEGLVASEFLWRDSSRRFRCSHLL